MRVALVSYYYPEYTLSLANALVARRVQTLLLLPKQNLEHLRQSVTPGLVIQPFSGRRLRDPLCTWEVCKIVRAIDSWRPDVIHLQQGHLWFNLVGLPLLRSRRLITTVHDVTSHAGDQYARRTPQWVWDIAARRAVHLIVHGQALKTEVARRYHIPANRIHVIPHGEFSLFSCWAQPDCPEQDIILFFGRIWPYKGLQYLIEAEPLISAQIPSARIVIAGEGESLERYERMMVHRDRFEVHNRFIPAEEVAGLFQRAAVVVLPYVEASQSGVIPLAYTFGKPVIATEVGSIPEVVADGETGCIVPPRDAPRLAEAIVRLLKDPALRHDMGKRARQKAETDLAWDRIAGDVCQVYQAALAG